MMRPHASLHADQARGHVGEPGFDLATRPLLSQHDGPTSIQANNMERVLPDIDADYGNSCLACLSHGVLLFICAPASLVADGAGARPDHPISGHSAQAVTIFRSGRWAIAPLVFAFYWPVTDSFWPVRLLTRRPVSQLWGASSSLLLLERPRPRRAYM